MTTKGERTQDSACELADAHWEFIEECLEYFLTTPQDLRDMEWSFKNGFVHGFKHGVEASEK